MADGTEDGVPVELVILLVGGVVVYYVFAGANRWWDGYRKQHNLLGQVATVTAFVLVALWFTQSSSGARVADLVLLAVLVLVAVAVVASIVAGRRRKARLAAMSLDAARASATRRIGSPRWNTERDDDGREVVVYAVAAFDSRTGDVRAIKIGSTASRDDLREAQVIAEQVGRMNVGKPLGRGPGGTRREQDLHRRLDTWRHPKSEWFAPSPEVIAAVGELDSLTNDGRQFVRTMAARRGA